MNITRMMMCVNDDLWAEVSSHVCVVVAPFAVHGLLPECNAQYP